MQSKQSRGVHRLKNRFFFPSYTLIIPNMPYCSVISALILFLKQSPFVRFLWIISESKALLDAIKYLAKIAPTSHKRGQELLLLYFPDQNNLWWSLDQISQALVFTVKTLCVSCCPGLRIFASSSWADLFKAFFFPFLDIKSCIFAPRLGAAKQDGWLV